MWWFLILCLCIGFLLTLMYWQSYRYTLNFISFKLNQLPKSLDGIQFVFISDIHRRTIPYRLIEKLKNVQIDYVFIGGDLAEKGVPIDRIENNVAKLVPLAPTYFVWGNHDIQYGKETLASILHKYHVKILENEAVLLHDEGETPLWLIGVGEKCNHEDDLEGALSTIPHENGCRILLSHVPTITKKIKLEHHISLVLSGHTHGGQIALPWIGAITGAVGELFPKQVVGFHNLEYTTIYISSGFGTSHYPLRLCTTPEIAVITLRSDTSYS